eukprot:5486504-Amphidinium_carterae.1
MSGGNGVPFGFMVVLRPRQFLFQLGQGYRRTTAAGVRQYNMSGIPCACGTVPGHILEPRGKDVQGVPQHMHNCTPPHPATQLRLQKV